MFAIPIIAVTPGEPAGIGPDLCVGLDPPQDSALVLVADPAILHDRARGLKQRFDFHPWPGRDRIEPGLYGLAIPSPAAVRPGILERENARYVLATLTRAADGCLSGEFDALVTGPVHKAILNEAGLPFTGHTEFLAARAGHRPVVMMLAAPGLRVALATTHLPLSEVPRAITRERLATVLRVLHADLVARFHIHRPRISVLGLNPHAGEGGHLGREEVETIDPVIQELRREGLQLDGPLPADTAFLPNALLNTDAVLAMYHDQGLPVLKHHDFAHAVNITLGLPFVRTSVDHGTALELAGRGQADPSSLLAAIAMARSLIH